MNFQGELRSHKCHIVMQKLRIVSQNLFERVSLAVTKLPFPLSILSHQYMLYTSYRFATFTCDLDI
jgi:hypothetical protein